MTEWSKHVHRFAKKHKMTYKQANVSKKCKEAYKKRKTSPKKMSPRRRRTSPRRRRMNNYDDDEDYAMALDAELNPPKRKAATRADAARRAGQAAGERFDEYLKDQPRRSRDTFYDSKKPGEK